MNKKISIFILILLSSGIFFFFNNAETPHQKKYSSLKKDPTLRIKKKKAILVKPATRMLKVQTQNLMQTIEDFLVKNTMEVDDDGTDWQDIHRQWFLKLAEYLEELYPNSQQGRKKFLKYLALKTKYNTDPNITSLHDKATHALKEYLELTKQTNIPKEKVQKAKEDYKRGQKRLVESSKKYIQEIKDFFGEDYEKVKNQLEQFNHELSNKNPHLGYKISISL